MTEEHREEGYVVPGSPAKLDVGHGDQQQAQPDASEPAPMAAEPKGGDAEEESEAKPTTAPTSPQVGQVEKAEQYVDTAVSKGGDDTPIPPALLPSPADLPHPAEALHRPDSPTTQLISSLRTQLNELADQTQALNAKLVASISRHAELEDQHVQLQDSHKDLQGKAQELEVEKKRWEESMNTGLLVERSQIAGEMQRLASGLVEEERRRGSAEERRAKVENEVDDLAASLFDQANTMVAAERMSRVQAESRLKETEENLAAAEAAVRDMQVHFQSLSTSSPPQSSSAPAVTSVAESKLLISHVPYTEFISFISHLRQLRPLKKTSKQLFPPPLVANLLTQAFLARVITEDQDPTVRLDAARDLSYFSRRTVGAAIISGELIVEPVSASTVIASTTTPPPEIGCSLCGKLVFPPNATHAAPNSPSGSHFGPPPNHPGLPAHRSSSRFSLKPFFNTTAATSPNANASPNQSPLASPSLAGSFSQLPSVYVFRVSKPASTATTGASSQATANANDKVYPLCKSGWCLERLRATCELWHFVRTGIIHVVWHGDDGYALSSEKPGEEINDKRSSIASTATQGETAEKPPLPERKRSAGGWGLGFKLGSSERTPSTGGGSTGGGGWFGRADSATPPPSSPSSAKAILADPADEPESKGRRAPGLDEEHDLATNSGEKERRDERETTPEQPEDGPRTSRDVPSIVEVEASPAGPPLDHGVGDEEDGKNLRPSMLGRADSSASLTPSAEGTEEGSFMTPKEQHHELDPEPEVTKEDGSTDDSAKEGDKPIDVPGDQVVPESDVQGGDTPQATDSPQPPASPSAPPIPRRAAARGRAVEKVDLGEQKPEEEKAEENTTEHATQPDLTEEKAAAVTEEANPTESAEIPAEAPVVDLNEDDKAEPATSAAKPPPPLPPRHPRTPTAQVPETTNPSIEVDGEKRWLKADAEGWEEKTWKTVVRLKEEMWRARVGVSGGA